ncbi:hypothetical protein O988_02317 [Pseudogymnoascus sp. VKM F-3808]|nr:hypothetical protein O988_02317 [Pseudogymnoascus sp. VKM F-3808]
MKTTVFAVVSALAAVSFAAPRHHQTICWEFIPQCPNGWYSNNKGTAAYPCWTCCKSPSESFETPSVSSTPNKEEIDINIKISDTSTANSASFLFEDPCWRVCWFKTPKCPSGWYSNNKGTAAQPCWTCCKSPSGSSETPSVSSTPDKEEIDINIKISDTSVANSASSLVEDVCWKVCWEFVPKCPDGMYSNNKGTAAYPCWTCCISPSVDGATSHRAGLTADL